MVKMGFESKLSEEQSKAIQDLAKSGMKITKIEETLKREKKIPKEISYEAIRQHARKIIKPKRVRTIEVAFIEDITGLCKNLTKLVLNFGVEFVNNQTDITVLEKEILELVGKHRLTKRDMRVANFKKTMHRARCYRLKDTKVALNKAFENFVNLLKVPIVQETQVNILYQHLEASLKRVLDGRPEDEIGIPLSATAR